MKRLIAGFISLVFLCACVPTPEQAFVVSKADNVLEQKLQATPKPVEDTVPALSKGQKAQSLPETTGTPTQAQFFPDRWDEDAQSIRDHVTLAVHADVIAKADGLYPVYRTRTEPITEARVIALADLLLSKPAMRELIDGMTKDDWAKELQTYLDEAAAWEAWVKAGRPDDGADRDDTASYTPEEVAEMSAWYMEQIKNAPDKLDKAKVSDYSDYRIGQFVRYTLEDGGCAGIDSFSNASHSGFTIVKGCQHIGYIYRETQYAEDSREGADALMKRSAKQWQQPMLSREDAEAIAYRETERLGFSGFSIAYSEPANLYDTTERGATRVAAGWSFVLRRDYDGYPLVEKHSYKSSDLLEYGDGDGFAYNKSIGIETVTVFVDETGILYFGYADPKAIVGKQTANVELLPFEEVIRIVKNTIVACYPSLRFQGSENRSFDLEVYRMVLTPYTLRVRDSEDYYEVPCWVAFFDGWHQGADREQQRTQSNWSAECIVINAVDGSVVHERAGY